MLQYSSHRLDQSGLYPWASIVGTECNRQFALCAIIFWQRRRLRNYSGQIQTQGKTIGRSLRVLAFLDIHGQNEMSKWGGVHISTHKVNPAPFIRVPAQPRRRPFGPGRRDIRLRSACRCGSPRSAITRFQLLLSPKLPRRYGTLTLPQSPA